MAGSVVTLANGDTGPGFDISSPGNPNFVAQVSVRGVFGVGGNVKIQSSDDNVSFADVAGLTTITATLANTIVVGHRFYRGVVTAGDGTTLLTIMIF